jgi:hypothetical protein
MALAQEVTGTETIAEDQGNQSMLAGTEQAQADADAQAAMANAQSQGTASMLEGAAQQQAVMEPGAEAGPAIPVPPEEDPNAVKAAGEYMTSDATVMGQLEKYLEADNPILKLAEAKARDQAQAGGMLGTSMAAGAARRAVFEQAGDWATTDTQGFQSLLGQQQQAEYSLGQATHEGDITSQLQKEAGDIQMEAQKQQQTFDREITEYQNSQENQRQAEQIAADQGMNTEQVKAQLKINADKITADLAINDAALANQLSIDMMKIDSSNQQAYVDAMKDLTYGYNEQVASIMRLTDDQMSTSEKQNMIAQLKEEYVGQSAMFASVWQAEVTIGDQSSLTDGTGTGDSAGINTGSPSGTGGGGGGAGENDSSSTSDMHAEIMANMNRADNPDYDPYYTGP